MKNMGLKNFDNSNKINLHTFAVCAYGESPYLEECVQSLLAQKVRTRILIATSTPNSYIYGIGEKYGIPVHINHGEKGLAGDWNFAYSCATTPLVTLAHQDDRYYVNYTEDVLAAAKKCRHPLIIFTDYNELRNGKTVTTNRLLKVKRPASDSSETDSLLEKPLCSEENSLYRIGYLLPCSHPCKRKSGQFFL